MRAGVDTAQIAVGKFNQEALKCGIQEDDIALE
jgi:hypothetical protein